MIECPPRDRAERDWTDEQRLAIERRQGDLLLVAGAGSGKTSVLVERFVRAVLEDGLEVPATLTITFTEKAAAEMRERIRLRLRELGAEEAARQTEGAFISTIHGFCARVLRAHALAAGLDPGFTVLDAPEAERLAEAAFDDAVEDVGPGAVELIAGYGAGPLREAILATYGELRSRGQLEPALPELPPAADLEGPRAQLREAAAAAARELGGLEAPPARVLQALERLGRCDEVVAAAVPWPGEVAALALPGGNGAALSTPVCAAYAEALAAFRVACEHHRAEPARELLDRLLRCFGRRYAERKRSCSGVDFEDLELLCRELLRSDAGLRERYRARFERIMVDELQDTNQVQLELIDLLARDNLFTVGDPHQSIYAFRHADVELFERRAERMAALGARATLRTNFRARREILEVVGAAFAGEGFERLRPGRDEQPAEDPRVELLVVDKGADWAAEGLAAPWRLAEARALAARVRELVDDGARPADIVLLTRATSDLRTYERELERRGIPTYVIGGRGYWSHPQVVDLVCYLRALANPRDEEALYTVLVSPLVGVSLDALVVLAARARSLGRDPWSVLREGALDEVPERETLAAFAAWFAGERGAVARTSIDVLIDRALALTGYDLAVLAMPGGRRRLANVRKLMRLAREHEAQAGRDLRGFLELVRRRSSEWTAGGARESEAPIEGEALDAVRLMTIHRAKGLEFEVVCVADLGRGPRWPAEILRVGRDGRLGLRLARPGTGRREPALAYRELGEERMEAEAREERRLFYVAMTRARERLILSGAARVDSWPESGSPIAWIGPALLADLPARVQQRAGVTEAGVRFSFLGEEDVPEAPPGAPAPTAPPSAAPAPTAPAPTAPAPTPGLAGQPARRMAGAGVRPPAPPVSTLSYSSLGEYERCGYRFYAERVLGLPARPARPSDLALATGALSATDRGVLVHALLEQLDFRRPLAPTPARIAAACEREGIAAVSPEEAAELAASVEAFARSRTRERLARATGVRREERFAFPLAGVLITGGLDVLAREPGGMLVVDYKSDRLEGADPAQVVSERYATQRLIYALAVLRAGAAAVEVEHLFLERVDEPVSATFTGEQAAALEAELARLAGGVLGRQFAVTDRPHRGVCEGCPAEGGLCSWPVELTRRETPDQLF